MKLDIKVTDEANRKKPFLPGWKSVLTVCVFWASIGMIHGASRYADIVKYQLDVEYGWLQISYYVVSYLAWSFITLVLLAVLARERYPFSIARIGIMFLIGLLVWVPLYLGADAAIDRLRNDGTFEQWVQQLINTSVSVIFFYSIVYVLMFIACIGKTLSDKNREVRLSNVMLKQQQAEKERLFTAQQINLMQAQLSPHFLFNCLGAISGLARHGEKTQQQSTLIEAVSKVGNLLRFTLQNSSDMLINLNE